METPRVHWRRNPVCAKCGGIGALNYFAECICADGAELVNDICQVIS